MKKFITILLLGILVFFSNKTSAQSTKEHKVVIQLNTADTASWSSIIGNIKNLQKVWPNNISIEVVVHGKALNLLVASKTHLTNDVNDLTKEGVVLSHPHISTTPSIGFARIDSSTSILAKLR